MTPSNSLARIKSHTLSAAILLALLVGGTRAGEDQVLPSDSSNSTVCAESGRELYASKQYREALEDFQKAISLDPTNATAYLGLGKCQYQLEEYEQAAESFRQYLSLESSPEGHYRLGASLQKLHRFNDAETEFLKAVDLFRKAIDQGSSKPEDYDGLGYSLFQLKRYAEAVFAYKKAVSLGGESAPRCESLGYCYFGTEDWAQARDWYHKCVSLDPHNFKANFNFGRCLFNLKSYEPAADAFQKAIQIKPDDSDANIILGDCFFKLRSYQQAVNAYRKAYELNKKNPFVRYELFWAYMMTSQFKKASEVYPLHYGILAGAVITLSDLIGYSAAVGTPLVLFGLGTALLLKKSFKVSATATPGLGFAFGWFLIYILGQFACTLVAEAFDLGGAVVGMVAAPIPLLVAATAAFPRQPWGAAFARPRSFPWKWVGVACLFLLLICLAGAGYAKLVESIAHKPLPHSHAHTFLKEMLGGHHIALAALAWVMLVPMAEEVLFRGLLFGALQKRLSPSWTILTTAIAFAAFHLDLPYFVPLFAIGVLCGWLRNKTGSVWISVIVHALINAFAFFVILASL